MRTELFTVTPDTGIESALRFALSKRISHFLVIDDGLLVGIVSLSDLRKARACTFIRWRMKSPVLCIKPDDTPEDALEIMKQNEVSCLPIITGTFLMGIVNRGMLDGSKPPPTPPISPGN